MAVWESNGESGVSICFLVDVDSATRISTRQPTSLSLQLRKEEWKSPDQISCEEVGYDFGSLTHVIGPEGGP